MSQLETTTQWNLIELEALIPGMLKKARGLNPGCKLQITNVPESRQFEVYQASYDNVLINLEGYGEFEQTPTSDGLVISRIR